MKKALIVEDHPDMVEILTLQLERLGFTVISASNGKEGVEKAIAEKPHLILMDIMMPVMDGREATRIIRSNKNTKNIPILAIYAEWANPTSARTATIGFVSETRLGSKREATLRADDLFSQFQNL